MKKDDLKKELDRFQLHEANEQTFSSWIQSGLTMIGFGFALGSIIAFMKAEHYEKLVIESIRIIALLLIIVGITSIVLALIQNRKKTKHIHKKYGHEPLPSLSLTIGIMISILGVAALIAILMHTIL